MRCLEAKRHGKIFSIFFHVSCFAMLWLLFCCHAMSVRPSCPVLVSSVVLSKQIKSNLFSFSSHLDPAEVWERLREESVGMFQGRARRLYVGGICKKACFKPYVMPAAMPFLFSWNSQALREEEKEVPVRRVVRATPSQPQWKEREV